MIFRTHLGSGFTKRNFKKTLKSSLNMRLSLTQIDGSQIEKTSFVLTCSLLSSSASSELAKHAMAAHHKSKCMEVMPCSIQAFRAHDLKNPSIHESTCEIL